MKKHSLATRGQNKMMGTGLGQGHGTNSPNLPTIRETELPLELARGLQPGTRRYKMGKCRILVSPPYQNEHEAMGWHMSISREDRLPNWDEIAHAWYTLVPEAEQRTGLLYLPRKDEYINIHNFCMQVHEEIVL